MNQAAFEAIAQGQIYPPAYDKNTPFVAPFVSPPPTAVHRYYRLTDPVTTNWRAFPIETAVLSAGPDGDFGLADYGDDEGSDNHQTGAPGSTLWVHPSSPLWLCFDSFLPLVRDSHLAPTPAGILSCGLRGQPASAPQTREGIPTHGVRDGNLAPA